MWIYYPPVRDKWLAPVVRTLQRQLHIWLVIFLKGLIFVDKVWFVGGEMDVNDGV